MHVKNLAIEPAMRIRLGAELIVPAGIDTDALGTFSGEIPRNGTMREVAIAKARMGMVATGLRLGLASEGTYGPHPSIPFAAAGTELLVLVDDELGVVVAESLIDETPVFSQATGASPDDVEQFLGLIAFPLHAVIVGPNEPGNTRGLPVKGIREREALDRAMKAAAAGSPDGLARVQTDMRAHMNPTRMATLGRLANKLADRLKVSCPACAAPGCGVTGVVNGLPCGWCEEPTSLVREQIFGCVRCEWREARPRPDGLTLAGPESCLHCNP
jgi:hypothetical protein